MDTIHWLIEHVSYGSIFFILYISGLGFPLPEEITLMAAGAAAAMGHVDLLLMILVCYVAVIGGDATAFAAGRYFGGQVYDSRLMRLLLPPKRLRKARFLFYKRGTQAVVIARFLPGLRVSAFFVAGSMHVSWWRFLIADSVALIVSAPVGLLLGWFLGSSLLTPEGYASARKVLHRYHLLVLAGFVALFCVLLGAWLVRRRLRQNRASRNRPAPEGPLG